PRSGEIDIMEAVNLGAPGAPERVFSTTHYGLPFPQNTFVSEPFEDFATPPQDDFHVYEVEWQAGQLRFFVDGVHYHSQNSDNWYSYGFDPNGVASLLPGDAPFDQRFHLLLNLALGGNLPGDTVDITTLPAQFEIDYVRVFQCEGADPLTARGCGRASADVVIKDAPDTPYTEQLAIYSDGTPTLSLTSADNSVATNTLVVGGVASNGGTITVNDLNAADGNNTAWNVGVSGGLGEVFLRSEDLADNPVLETGFDLSGSADAGQIVFDLKVNSIEPGTTISAGLRTDANAFGLQPLDPMPTAPGSFITYAINIGDLLAVATRNGTNPVDLEDILDIFLLQIDGTADIFIDNIRITTACREAGQCTATLNFKSLPFEVFIDDVAPIWDRGIGAADNSAGFEDYLNGDEEGRKVNWTIRAADDAARGNIIDVTFNEETDFAVWFIQTSESVPLNAYATGSVVFDINVLDYGTYGGMTMKIDCIFPCTSGDQSIGMVGANGWEEVRVPVAQLINSGLSLETVNTGLVLFPTPNAPNSQQAGEINFLIDNVRWEPPITRQDVFFDTVDATWDGGIGAADSGSGFATYRDGNLPGAKVNWQILTDGDPLRSQVVEVTFNDSAETACGSSTRLRAWT
ncbi:MAG: family 16 glycosylhydrolase, partial [Pseudomonadota bacterium]